MMSSTKMRNIRICICVNIEYSFISRVILFLLILSLKIFCVVPIYLLLVCAVIVVCGKQLHLVQSFE